MEDGAQVQVELTLKPAGWSPDAERWISKALAHASIAEMRDQVRRGANVVEVWAGGEMVGAFILRLDSTVDGVDGVIVAAGGNLPGADLTALLLPYIERMFIGVRRVRIHTMRPGMARKLEGAGYKLAELVFVKDIQDV